MSVVATSFIIIGFLLHRYIILPWSIEFLLLLALVFPYLEPQKKTREIGIQTDSDVVTLTTKKRLPVNKIATTIGLFMIIMFYFF